MPLPTQKSQPEISLQNFTTLIYGAPKRGKSTFAAGFPSALFLDCESGLNSLSVYRQPVDSWFSLCAAVAEISAGNHQYRTIVIDTVDVAFQYCTAYVLKKLNLVHESDAEYGKGWSLVTQEFSRVLRALALLPYGLVMISHAKEKEIKTRTGKQIKIVPTLPDRAAKTVVGMVDLLLYVDIDAEDTEAGVVERSVIRTKPTSYYDAGDRTGLLPATLPLDYQAFERAFRQVAASSTGEPRTPHVTEPETDAEAVTA